MQMKYVMQMKCSGSDPIPDLFFYRGVDSFRFYVTRVSLSPVAPTQREAGEAFYHDPTNRSRS